MRACWTFAALAGLSLATACSKPPSFDVYEDPGGDFKLEAPKGWQLWGNAARKPRPISAVMFVGKVEMQDEGMPIGAVLSITKLYRRRADYPGKDEGYRRFRQDVLVPSSVLFGEPASLLPEAMRKMLPQKIDSLQVSGFPARSYGREYEHFTRSHTDKPIPIRLEDLVVQTPEAYYVIEYRATTTLFAKYHFAAERARSSFTLKK